MALEGSSSGLEDKVRCFVHRNFTIVFTHKKRKERVRGLGV